MVLKAEDIKKNKFSKSIRGYDPIEVEAYIEVIADQFDVVLQENDNFKIKINNYEKSFNEFESNRDNFKSEQRQVTKELESLRSRAEKEAKIIIMDSKLKRDNIINNAYKEVSRLRQEIDELKMIKNNFITRIKNILRQQIETIEIYEKK